MVRFKTSCNPGGCRVSLDGQEHTFGAGVSVLGWIFKKVQPKTRIVQAFPSWNPESGFDRRSVIKRHERLPRVPGASSLVFLFVPLGFITFAGFGDPFF